MNQPNLYLNCSECGNQYFPAFIQSKNFKDAKIPTPWCTEACKIKLQTKAKIELEKHISEQTKNAKDR